MRHLTQIHLHCLCWNERRIIPWFLQHYLPIVDKIFVYDNFSTDGSAELFSGDERISIEKFQISGDSFVSDVLRRSETMWCRSRGTASWVIVVDIDEHLYHSDLRQFLNGCTADGITAIRAEGYQMIAEEFPPLDQPLTRSVTRGIRSPDDLDKLCLFDPNAIVAVNFDEGRHRAKPTGRVVWSNETVKLLHYKELGLEYYISRTRELRAGLRPGDIARGWGVHYTLPEAHLAAIFLAHQTSARSLIGLDQRLTIPRIEIEVGGRRISPATDDNCEFRFPLPEACQELWLVLPAGRESSPGLGVGVREISVESDWGRQLIPLASSACREGWWRPSDHNGQTVRWTSERARIALPKVVSREMMLCVSLTSD